MIDEIKIVKKKSNPSRHHLTQEQLDWLMNFHENFDLNFNTLREEMKDVWKTEWDIKRNANNKSL
jgi:hypothetical protein